MVPVVLPNLNLLPTWYFKERHKIPVNPEGMNKVTQIGIFAIPVYIQRGAGYIYDASASGRYIQNAALFE